MNVRNLFVYHCFNEIFKILKFRTPISLFEVFELSKRNGRETRLITPEPSLNFTYQAALIWNVAREVLQLDDLLMTPLNGSSAPGTHFSISKLRPMYKKRTSYLSTFQVNSGQCTRNVREVW